MTEDVDLRFDRREANEERPSHFRAEDPLLCFDEEAEPVRWFFSARDLCTLLTRAGRRHWRPKWRMVRPDGVIGRRFAVDLGPLKPEKKSVKLFDIDGTACDQVGSFLINDVMECKSDTGPVADCLKDIGVSTLTNVQLNK